MLLLIYTHYNTYIVTNYQIHSRIHKGVCQKFPKGGAENGVGCTIFFFGGGVQKKLDPFFGWEGRGRPKKGVGV